MLQNVKYYLKENRQYNDHAMGVVGPAVGDEKDERGESSEGEEGGVGEEEGGEDLCRVRVVCVSCME